MKNDEVSIHTLRVRQALSMIFDGEVVESMLKTRNQVNEQDNHS